MNKNFIIFYSRQLRKAFKLVWQRSYILKHSRRVQHKNKTPNQLQFRKWKKIIKFKLQQLSMNGRWNCKRTLKRGKKGANEELSANGSERMKKEEVCLWMNFIYEPYDMNWKRKKSTKSKAEWKNCSKVKVKFKEAIQVRILLH